MKTLILTLTAIAITFAATAQGTVNLGNQAQKAKIFRSDGTTPAGAGFTAQLALVKGDGSLSLLATTTTFQTKVGFQFYVISTPVTITPSNTGDKVDLKLLVWETVAGSYQAAHDGNGFSWGISATPAKATLGGPVDGAPDAFPGNLTGLSGFTLTQNPTVPEPTTYALLGLGGLALALRRRK